MRVLLEIIHDTEDTGEGAPLPLSLCVPVPVPPVVAPDPPAWHTLNKAAEFQSNITRALFGALLSIHGGLDY